MLRFPSVTPVMAKSLFLSVYFEGSTNNSQVPDCLLRFEDSPCKVVISSNGLPRSPKLKFSCMVRGPVGDPDSSLDHSPWKLFHEGCL